MHASPSTEASELPHSRGKKRTTEKTKQGERTEASTVSFITNLFHPVVEMGHCSLRALPKRQVCPPRRAVKEEFLSRVVHVSTASLRPSLAFPFARDR